MIKDHQKILTEITKLCAERHINLTPQRRLVLELMLNAGKAMSAYELLDLLKEHEPKAKPPTIYRALDFFIEQGMIHKVESSNSYVICTHLRCNNHLSILFVCNLCKQTFEHHDHKVELNLKSLAFKECFNETQSIIEIHGKCKNCASSVG